ncbi:hypothetical protein [Thermogemmatispora sp.]|uniref:hypothetical protein n=1 Tax=Thermogemmatispora sp. TaxID=1968838 RepID=UPI0035E42AF3
MAMNALLRGLNLAAPNLADRQELRRLFGVCGYALSEADDGGEPPGSADESRLVRFPDGEPIACADLCEGGNEAAADLSGLICRLSWPRLLVHSDYRRRGLGRPLAATG